MKQEHREMVAFGLAALAHKPALPEKAFEAERTLPKLHKNSLAFEPVMLKSALFRPGSGARTTYADYSLIRAHGPHRIEYLGEELRQDDLRVLLVLLKARSGQRVDGVQQFVPRTFCRDALGWADSGESVSKLRACIIRLHSARVRVTYATKGLGLYSFISDADLTGEKWSVWLSERLATMFEGATTYIPQPERLALRDGFVSWLYGFVKADACLTAFSAADLREWSGCTSYEQKAFNRHLRAGLDQLRQAGLIQGYEMSAGSVRIRK